MVAACEKKERRGGHTHCCRRRRHHRHQEQRRFRFSKAAHADAPPFATPSFSDQQPRRCTASCLSFPLSFFLSFSTKRPAARAVEEAEGGDSWPGSSVLSDVPGASITATSRAHTECCLGENGGAVPPAATRRYRNLQMTFLIWLRRDN